MNTTTIKNAHGRACHCKACKAVKRRIRAFRKAVLRSAGADGWREVKRKAMGG